MISDELFERCLRAVHLAPPDKPTLALLLDMATVQVDAFTAALELAFSAGRESAYTTDDEIDFVTWDHREHPYSGDIDQLVSKLSGGRIRVTNVDDTGSDQHALAFGGRKLEQDEATEVYRAWLRRQWEDD